MLKVVCSPLWERGKSQCHFKLDTLQSLDAPLVRMLQFTYVATVVVH